MQIQDGTDISNLIGRNVKDRTKPFEIPEDTKQLTPKHLQSPDEKDSGGLLNHSKLVLSPRRRKESKEFSKPMSKFPESRLNGVPEGKGDGGTGMSGMEEISEVREDDASCCFCFSLNTKSRKKKYAKGYSGKQPQRKHRPPQADSFDVEMPYAGGMKKLVGPFDRIVDDQKRLENKQFIIFLWSAVMGMIKKRDVDSMTKGHIRFFLPILLQYGHLYDSVMHKCQNEKFLLMELFFWIRSNPDPIAKDFRASASSQPQNLFDTINFYETMVLEPGVNGEVKEGTQILSKKSSIAVPFVTLRKQCHLDKVVFKKKFASGHAPILVDLVYVVKDDFVRRKVFKQRGSISSSDKRSKVKHGHKFARSYSDRNVSLFNLRMKKSSSQDFFVSKAKMRRQMSEIGKTLMTAGASSEDAASENFHTMTILMKPDCVCRAAAVARMMELFNFLWRQSWMHGENVPLALSYLVIPGGPKWGFIQCIPDAKSSKEFEFAKISQLYSQGLVDKIAQKKFAIFLRSVVGGCVAGHVLGLRDRHSDNILISEGYKFYHIDFKHCFNIATKVVDAPSMVIPKGLHRLLVKIRKWDYFLDLCVEAFTVLRRSSEHLIQVSQLMFAGQVDPDVIDSSYIQCFYLGCTEKKARAHFRSHVTNLPGNISTKIKEFVHANSPNLRNRQIRKLSFREALNPALIRAKTQPLGKCLTPSPQQKEKFNFNVNRENSPKSKSINNMRFRSSSSPFTNDAISLKFIKHWKPKSPPVRGGGLMESPVKKNLASDPETQDDCKKSRDSVPIDCSILHASEHEAASTVPKTPTISVVSPCSGLKAGNSSALRSPTPNSPPHVNALYQT